MLDKNRLTRLGAKGEWKEILKHPFFKNVDIDGIAN